MLSSAAPPSQSSDRDGFGIKVSGLVVEALRLIGLGCRGVGIGGSRCFGMFF